MPRVPMSLLLRLLRADGRGRRFVTRHHRHGVAGLRRFQHHVRDLRRFRRGGWNRQDLRRHHRNGARPSYQPVQPHAPLQPDVPDWLLAGPPFWCSVHGWVVCPLHQYDFPVQDAPLQPPTPAVVEAEAGAPLVQVREGDKLGFVSAPTGASIFAFGSGVGGSSNHTVVDVEAIAPRLPSPTPATPPPSPRSGARSRLMALGVPLASSPSSGRSGIWSPAALGLANGVAPGSHLPGGSSSEDERGAASRR